MNTKTQIILLGTVASTLLAREAAAVPVTQSATNNLEFFLFCDGGGGGSPEATGAGSDDGSDAAPGPSHGGPQAGSSQISLFRVFDLSGLAPTVDLDSIEFGVGVTSDIAGGVTYSIEVFSLDGPIDPLPPGGFSLTDLTLIHSQDEFIADTGLALVTIDLGGVTLDTSLPVVIGVTAPDGTLSGDVSGFATNDDGETFPTFVIAEGCAPFSDPFNLDIAPFPSDWPLTLEVSGFCGDDEVVAPEQCDDGNDVASDGCENDCTFTDHDGDGVPSNVDNCPLVPNDDQDDDDGDGLGNVCDDFDDDDVDDDGVVNVDDNCPFHANPLQEDVIDGDGIGDACDSFDNSDVDDDGDDNGVDNCPFDANPDQADADGDGQGDVCDIDDTDANDADGDGDLNIADNCPFDPNADQADADGDGLGDACDPITDDGQDLDGDGESNDFDNCPFTDNADQDDADGDGIGDACDNFDDTDVDADGVENGEDNCPFDSNDDQADEDGDGLGDECDGGNSGGGDSDVTVNGSGCGDAGGGGSGLAGLVLVGLSVLAIRRRRLGLVIGALLTLVLVGQAAASPITQNNDPVDLDFDLDCYDGEGDPLEEMSMYRVFDLSGLAASVEVRAIQFGARASSEGIDQPIGVNIYSIDSMPTGPGFALSDLTPISSETVDVSNSGLALFSFDLDDVTIDTSSPFVVEVSYPGELDNGDSFGFGMNNAGQTGPSFVRTVCAGSADPVDFAEFAGPLPSFVMTLDVFGFCGDGEIDAATEVCDDGNALDDDGCDTTCEFSDFDGDGEPTATDNCPFVPNNDKSDDQEDDDGDGIGNACDDLDNDDVDGDGYDNVDDNCPWVWNGDGKGGPGQYDADNDGIGEACDDFDDFDVDGDGIDNVDDNCPFVPNNPFRKGGGPTQEDTDGDGIGDECDDSDGLDVDEDGDLNADDNCPFEPNADQADEDGDGFGDVCDPTTGNNGDIDGDGDPNPDDNCPFEENADQADGDGDGIGDECDMIDNDDADGDGVENSDDNCPFFDNADQDDEDGDGLGDDCDGAGTGESEVNVNGGCQKNDVGGGASGLSGLALVGLALAFVRRRRRAQPSVPREASSV